jgi:uncharacterized phage protein (TIGR02218 family)
MKVPSWEPSAGALMAFLNSSTALIMADLYTFTTAGGTVYRFTSSDVPATVNGKSFSLGPKLERTTITNSVGIAVDVLTIEAFAEDSVTLAGVPFVQALGAGIFDGASVQLERAFSSATTVYGTVILFAGRVGEVQTERGHVTIEVLSHTELLDVMIPSGVYQPSCRNTLFDLNCGLARATYKISKPAGGATDTVRTSFGVSFTSTPATVADYLALGTATCTAGANVGVSRTIKNSNVTGITVVAPWPYAVAPGDTFDFYPGCDKLKNTCNTKFSNLVHFAAEPYVPLPDMIV